MNEGLLEAWVLLGLAIALVTYVLLPSHGVRLHGRFVGEHFGGEGVRLYSATSVIKIRSNGAFSLVLRAGDSVTLEVSRRTQLLATIRVETSPPGALDNTIVRSIDMGNIELARFGEGCPCYRILRFDWATVVLMPAGGRLPPVEHQLLDRAPYWPASGP